MNYSQDIARDIAALNQQFTCVVDERDIARKESTALAQRVAKLETVLRSTADALEENANNCCECDACVSAALDAEVVIFRTEKALAERESRP